MRGSLTAALIVDRGRLASARCINRAYGYECSTLHTHKDSLGTDSCFTHKHHSLTTLTVASGNHITWKPGDATRRTSWQPLTALRYTGSFWSAAGESIVGLVRACVDLPIFLDVTRDRNLDTNAAPVPDPNNHSRSDADRRGERGGSVDVGCESSRVQMIERASLIIMAVTT